MFMMLKINDLTTAVDIGPCYAESVVMETTINEEIAAYESLRESLEAEHMGKWALIHNREVIAVLDSFEQAAEEAVRKFGRGPYLIRQIGAPPMTLPASVMYHPINGQSHIRLH
jgi:hypothetical protein